MTSTLLSAGGAIAAAGVDVVFLGATHILRKRENPMERL
jgi:hypothetical protein